MQFPAFGGYMCQGCGCPFTQREGRALTDPLSTCLFATYGSAQTKDGAVSPKKKSNNLALMIKNTVKVRRILLTAAERSPYGY